MNDLINQQRERIAELEAEVERLKEWYITGEKQLKGRQDYARDQLQRAETAEKRVKELEDEAKGLQHTYLANSPNALTHQNICLTTAT